MFRLQKKVFASYSENDRDIVAPVVKLLRAVRGWVFFAPDSIDAGAIWERELEAAVRKCKLMVVFWCKHSSESTWVRNEYTLAIRLKKQLIPVLLDSTPLPDELHRYQGIDFRGAVANHEGEFGEAPSGFSSVTSLLVDDKFNVSIGKRLGYRHSRQRIELALIFGALLIVLAILRPFPTLINSEAVTAFNLMVGMAGTLMCYVGLKGLRKLNSFSVEEARAELAVALQMCSPRE